MGSREIERKGREKCRESGRAEAVPEKVGVV
jgi:hypothetical protein